MYVLGLFRILPFNWCYLWNLWIPVSLGELLSLRIPSSLFWIKNSFKLKPSATFNDSLDVSFVISWPEVALVSHFGSYYWINIGLSGSKISGNCLTPVCILNLFYPPNYYRLVLLASYASSITSYIGNIGVIGVSAKGLIKFIPAAILYGKFEWWADYIFEILEILLFLKKSDSSEMEAGYIFLLR